MGLMDRVMNFLVPEVEEDDSPVEEKAKWGTQPEETGKRGAVVSLHASKHYRVVVVEPTNFDESQGIVEHLKSRRQVIINLEGTEKDVAQRILDFVSGACYALDGRVQKVSQGVILFVPHNVDITNELKSESDDHTILPWLIPSKEKRS